MKKYGVAMALMAVLAGGMLRADGLEVEMQDEWSLKISHPAAGDLCTNTRLTINDAAGHLLYYTRQMGAYWHENVPMNENGVSRLVQYGDAKSRAYFHLEDYSARLSEDGDSVTVHIAGNVLDDAKYSAEYALICVPKYLADGTRFTAVTSDGTQKEGKVPDEDSNDTLAKDCRHLTLAMTAGTLDIEVQTGETLTFLDRRLAGYERGKCLFIGLVGRDMSTPLNSTVKLTFKATPGRTLLKPLPVQEGAALAHVPVSFRTPSLDYSVNTQCIAPKEFTDLGAASAAAVPFQLRLPDGLPQEDVRRLTKAVSRLETPPVPLELRTSKDTDGWTLPKDGFTIDRNDASIVVTAATPRALFYGIQALRDLDLSRRFTLKDWPDLDFRSEVVYFIGEEFMETIPFFMQEIWTRGRINALIVVNCQNCQWETVSELWKGRKDPYPSKEQFRQLVAECRDNYIEPIPQLSLFGHCEWLFQNGAHLELAEDPARPYNYNVSDPRVYEIIEPLMDEMLELFKPAYFHIGHDEIDCARTVIYPTRPENKALGMAELYRRDVWRLHDFLAKRNVKTMLWHDGMCAGDEEECGNPADLGDIRAFRATLPKDLVVLFWEYSDGRSYGGVRHLQEEGFSVIGCPWYNEGNIKNMVATAKKEHSLGISGTSWWPVHTWDYICNAYPPQYPAHLLTACLAWGGPTAEQIPLRRYADIIYDMIRQRVELDKRDDMEGYALDLSPMANVLPTGKGDGLLPADFSAALKPGQLLKVGRGRFVIPARDGKLAAIAMQSFPDGPLFPNKVELPMTGRLHTVHLLGALTGPVPDSHNNTQAMDVVFHYEGGESETVVMQYNANMGHLVGRASYRLNKTTSVEGDGGRLWDNAVQNPKPEKVVSGLELVSHGHGFVLFGVSGEVLPEP